MRLAMLIGCALVLAIRCWTRFTSSGSYLAYVYHQLGKYAEAARLQLVVLAWQRQVLGDGHAETIGNATSLVASLESLGKHTEATQTRQWIQLVQHPGEMQAAELQQKSADPDAPAADQPEGATSAPERLEERPIAIPPVEHATPNTAGTGKAPADGGHVETESEMQMQAECSADSDGSAEADVFVDASDGVSSAPHGLGVVAGSTPSADGIADPQGMPAAVAMQASSALSSFSVHGAPSAGGMRGIFGMSAGGVQCRPVPVSGATSWSAAPATSSGGAQCVPVQAKAAASPKVGDAATGM